MTTTTNRNNKTANHFSPAHTTNAYIEGPVRSDTTSKHSSRTLREKLFEPVDASTLVVFRIGFGLIMLWEVWRYWTYGWISEYYIEPDFHFKYIGFEWVEPWPGDWM
jgi:hypothetical protein